MASYARCTFILLITLSLSYQTHARDSKFFSKVTKSVKKTLDPISISPVSSPSLAPALSPEPEVVEHGYGLYGRDPYEYKPTGAEKRAETPVFGEEKYVPVGELAKESSSENFETVYGNGNGNGNEYQYSPTTGNPTNTHFVGEEKFDMGKGMGMGMDTDVEGKRNGNGNEYVSDKQGMSDTRFLENGKYYYDANHGDKDERRYVGKEGNENEYGNRNGYAAQKEGMSDTRYENGNGKQGMNDTRFLENGKYYYDVGENGKDVERLVENEGNGYGRNGNGNVPEKQGMSDTRFLENGKYFYDIENEEGTKMGKLSHLNANNNNENEQIQEEKIGMSDTRFLDNGKYFYDVNDENENHKNLYNNNNIHKNEESLNENNNNRYGNGYGSGYRNGNEEEHYDGNNNYVTEKRGGYHYSGNTNTPSYGTKKLANEYDTMEEYDREQGYVDLEDVHGHGP